MSEELDFLDGDQPAQTTAAVEQPVETPAEPHEGPARGPDGKFVPKAAEAPQEAPQPAPEPVQVQPVEAKSEPAAPPPGYVPLSALQDVRKELQALKQQVQPPAPMPSIYEDPDGYQVAVQQQTHGIRLDYSRRLASAVHGAETVDQAHEWAFARCDADPVFNQQVLSARDPYEFVVSEYKRDKAIGLLTQLDPARLEQLLTGINAPAQSAQAAPAAIPPQPIPTPSLASAPAAGSDKPGAMPIHEGAAFDAIFR